MTIVSMVGSSPAMVVVIPNAAKAGIDALGKRVSTNMILPLGNIGGISTTFGKKPFPHLLMSIIPLHS